jgi:hypothetical protein
MGFESQTPRWDKAIALGRLLAEESGKTDEARKLLQGVLDDTAASDESRAYAGVLMAETWLLDAARIDPTPTPRNATQVARAKAQMGDDRVPWPAGSVVSHDLSHLLPFVADVRDADEVGKDGLTALCRGAQLLNVTQIRAALAAGAAVDGNCAGSTALAYVVRAGHGFFERKTPIVVALLEAGADPDPKLYPSSTYTAMTFCEEALPGCSASLLPLLSDAKAARAKTTAPLAAKPVD